MSQIFLSNMAIVYIHKRTDTGEVFYVGIGNQEKRAYSKSSRGKFWMDYTSKYEYEVEITHRDVIWEEACCIEKYLICFYGRRDLNLGTLVNVTDGGDGLINAGELTRKKMSLAKIGKTTWNKGVSHSQETKDKISKANKGRKLPSMSEEAKTKISEGNKGKTPWNKNKKVPHREETKAKISIANKGKLLGKQLSESHKQKIKESKIGLVAQKVTCPYCQKIGITRNMKRWHFDNCKNR